MNKIRNKEIVLWVGAGFSRCGGFQSGYGLLEIIKSKYTECEKEKFKQYSLLPDFVEKFVRLRGGKRENRHTIV